MQVHPVEAMLALFTIDVDVDYGLLMDAHSGEVALVTDVASTEQVVTAADHCDDGKPTHG